MRSFSPALMPAGTLNLTVSPLTRTLISPPCIAVSKGISIELCVSRLCAPPKPPPKLLPLKPLKPSPPPKELKLNPPREPELFAPKEPPKMLFRMSFRSPIFAEPCAKSWKFCPPNISSPWRSYCARFFSSLKISYAALISLNLSSAPGSLLISG